MSVGLQLRLLLTVRGGINGTQETSVMNLATFLCVSARRSHRTCSFTICTILHTKFSFINIMNTDMNVVENVFRIL